MTRRVEQQGVPLMGIAALLVLFLTAGCAGMDRAPKEPARAEVTQDRVPAPKPQQADVKPEKPVAAKPAQVAPKPDVAVVAKPVPPSASVIPSQSAAKPEALVEKPEAPAAKPAAKAAATPATKEPAPKKEVATPPAPKPAAAPLDLAGLVKKLKETNAIGVFTKLTLKNQVDTLLEQFRGYYQGRIKTSLDQLRQPYDQLLMKVLSLLQDSDPPLAHEITQSREAIWGILSDPDKFDDL